MTLKRLAFPLAEDRAVLQERWWHRLCVVLFAVSLVLFFALAGILLSDFVDETRWNITIKNNLQQFAAQSAPSIPNTVPAFVKLSESERVGCMEDDGAIRLISSYRLEKAAFCSADIVRHLGAVTTFVKERDSFRASLVDIEKWLVEILSEDTEKRYCFIPEDLHCKSEHIIAYRVNMLYHLHIVLYALLATYLFALILQLVYFKGLIYIIYGRYRRPNPPPS